MRLPRAEGRVMGREYRHWRRNDRNHGYLSRTQTNDMTGLHEPTNHDSLLSDSSSLNHSLPVERSVRNEKFKITRAYRSSTFCFSTVDAKTRYR